MKRDLLYMLLACTVLSSCGQNVLDILEQLPQSANGPMDQTKDLTALVFLDIDCPISQYVIKPMNSICQLHDASLNVVGIVPGDYYSDQEKSDFVSNFSVLFEVRHDVELKAVKRLKATVTPQCFLLDGKGNVLYNGALDNKYEALGRSKPTPSINYLEMAIGEAMEGKKVELSKTKAVGCLIEQ